MANNTWARHDIEECIIYEINSIADTAQRWMDANEERNWPFELWVQHQRLERALLALKWLPGDD